MIENRPKSAFGLRAKEWWYLHLFDEVAGKFVSASFARSKFVDQIMFLYSDNRTGQNHYFRRNGRITLSSGTSSSLCAAFGRSAVMKMEQRGEQHVLSLDVAHGGLSLQGRCTFSSPPQRRRQHAFKSSYEIGFLVGGPFSCELTIDGTKAELRGAASYVDHSFGVLGAYSSWHWLCVQNSVLALNVLKNYGVDPNCFSYARMDDEWERLSLDVVFDYDPRDLSARWSIVSPDLDLVARPIRVHRDSVKIPPLVPFLLNLEHNEVIVEVSGRVRRNGTWIETGALHGVIEEHFGRW